MCEGEWPVRVQTHEEWCGQTGAANEQVALGAERESCSIGLCLHYFSEEEMWFMQFGVAEVKKQKQKSQNHRVVWHRFVGAGLEKDHEGEQKAGAPLLGAKAERAGDVQTGEGSRETSLGLSSS